MSDSSKLSPASRRRLIVIILIGISGLSALLWVVIEPLMHGTKNGKDTRPAIYDIAGAHPGDLAPNETVDDNARYYGIDDDLPYTFQTNTLGFRGTAPRSNARPVVLILGDSFAFGMGVNDGETFPDTLQRTLQAEGYEGLVVHNAALPGYTITDQIEQWREKLSALKPDLVLLCHTASDLKEMARPTSFRRLMRWDDEDASLSDSEIETLVNGAGGRSELIRDKYVFRQEELVRRLGAQAPVVLQQYQHQYIELMVKLRDEIEGSGALFGLVLWVQGYGMAGLTTSTLKDVAQRANIAVFDGDAAMQSQGDTPINALFLPDKHFSPAGNSVAGKQTAAWLIKRKLLD